MYDKTHYNKKKKKKEVEGWDGEGGGRGGSEWGIHANPWLIHVNVWQKPLQYCKVISLQLIKINEKKKKKKKKKVQAVPSQSPTLLHCLNLDI